MFSHVVGIFSCCSRTRRPTVFERISTIITKAGKSSFHKNCLMDEYRSLLDYLVANYLIEVLEVANYISNYGKYTYIEWSPTYERWVAKLRNELSDHPKNAANIIKEIYKWISPHHLPTNEMLRATFSTWILYLLTNNKDDLNIFYIQMEYACQRTSKKINQEEMMNRCTRHFKCAIQKADLQLLFDFILSQNPSLIMGADHETEWAHIQP